MTIKDLKRGEYFTLKEIEYPSDTQVYVRGEYDRSEKKYGCYKFSDMNSFRYLKGSKTVFMDFIF